MDGKCSATNKSGAPCSAQAWRDGICRWHHPALEGERQAARRRGGESRSNRVRAGRRYAAAVLSLRAVQGMLSAVLEDVIAGEVEPGIATAAATVGRAIASVAQVGDLEQRLLDLEQRAGVETRSA